MTLKSGLLLLILVTSLNCFAETQSINTKQSQNTILKTTDSVTREVSIWLDQSRDRQIPIATYTNRNLKFSSRKQQQLVILSPGYPGKNTDYGYIARNLAMLGYFVITIQNDLPTDPPIPTTGNIYDARMPFWNTGVSNILFVKNKLQELQPKLDYKQLVLIGHSNGGDISMLFATKYPDLVKTVISLDNRRMPFPRNSKPRIFSIRSKDQAADLGVIPTDQELIKYNMTLVKINTIHDDMGGLGTADQLKEINNYITNFLKR